MKWNSLIGVALLAIGCNQPKPQPEPQPQKSSAPKYYKVDPAEAASLRGKVRFEGKRPAAKRISMDAEEACQALHKTPVFEERVLVGKDSGLANVLVYIKTGLEGHVFAPVGESVVIDQRGCQFIPRVVALRSGQTLTVKNSDPVSHSIHPMPKNNRDWNQQQPSGAPDLQRRFARAEVMIPVKCNIHAWMKSYVGVLDHPFYAVTDRNGEFAMEGLPPGSYTLAAWHEAFGEITQSIAVGKGEAGTAKFVFQTSLN